MFLLVLVLLPSSSTLRWRVQAALGSSDTHSTSRSATWQKGGNAAERWSGEKGRPRGVTALKWRKARPRGATPRGLTAGYVVWRDVHVGVEPHSRLCRRHVDERRLGCSVPILPGSLSHVEWKTRSWARTWSPPLWAPVSSLSLSFVIAIGLVRPCPCTRLVRPCPCIRPCLSLLGLHVNARCYYCFLAAIWLVGCAELNSMEQPRPIRMWRNTVSISSGATFARRRPALPYSIVYCNLMSRVLHTDSEAVDDGSIAYRR